jgi:hypothetical protein
MQPQPHDDPPGQPPPYPPPSEYYLPPSTQPPNRQPSLPPKKKRRTWLWIVLCALAVLVFVLAYLYNSRHHVVGEDVHVGLYSITILGGQTATLTLTQDGGTIVSGIMTVTIDVRVVDTTTGLFAAPGDWFIEANGQTYDAAYHGSGIVVFDGIPSGITMFTLGLHCNNGSTVYWDLVFTRSSPSAGANASRSGSTST